MNFEDSFNIANTIISQKQQICIVCKNDKNAQALTKQLDILIGENKVIAYLPSPQTLLYEKLEPSPNIVSTRLKTLYAWHKKSIDCIIMSINTISRPMPALDFLGKNCLQFKENDHINYGDLRETLSNWSYEYADYVCDPGTFAIRGAIIDIFPYQSEFPIRIELFDDAIESIFEVRPNNLIPKQEIAIFPDREYEINDLNIEKFKIRWQKHFGLWGQKSELYQRTNKKKITAGIHQWLAWFYPNNSNWWDYQHKHLLLMEPDSIAFHKTDIKWATKYYENHNADSAAPIPPVADVITNSTQLQEKLANNLLKWPVSSMVLEETIAKLEFFETQHEAETAATNNNGLVINEHGKLAKWLKTPKKGYFASYAKLGLLPSVVNGFSIYQHQNKHQVTKKTEAVANNKITIGSIVVHNKYGIGKLKEITSIDHMGDKIECLVITYAKDGKVFVPITEIEQISKFKELDDAVELSELGKKTWKNKQTKALEKMFDDAAMLIKLHAKRKQEERAKYHLDDVKFNKFIEMFPFEDTEDQKKITRTIIDDLCNKAYPAERLVCGDVGFGKTEIALRATWLVVSNGKQIAWLAPTTILARQHAQRIRERFHDDCFSVIECIGGNKINSEQANALASGHVDIIVGTHGILNKQLQFANLGMIIIDEEHKFGVKQKDNLSVRYPKIDVLYLSATPIPRSLNMAMSSLKDISLLASPPPDRVDVKTFIGNINDDDLIQGAILRELQRGGQVYFCYNRIDRLEEIKNKIQVWFPEANTSIIHGQMQRVIIKEIMQDFSVQKIDILICSSIVESGIDYANANTIIVLRADLFGLSQLHQLRGRVGRAKLQAYAYFLVPDIEHQTNECQKRIEAISKNSGLGCGFSLAIEDLEIRGAGNILGKKQSGHINEMGFLHYIRLLEKTMKWIKNYPDTPLDVQEILSDKEFNYSVPYSTIIPEQYIFEPNERLACYQELSDCKSHLEIDKLRSMWVKKYGVYPKEVDDLLNMAHIKIDVIGFGVRDLKLDGKKLILSFAEKELTESQIVKMVSKPHIYSLRPPSEVVLNIQSGLKETIALIVSDLKI